MALDHHVHSQFDGCGYGDAFELADLAGQHGVTHLGFAESFPLPAEFADRVIDEMYMPGADFPHYVDTVRGVRAEFADQQMTVLIGAEVDFLPEFSADIFQRMQAHRTHIDFWALGNHFLADCMFTLSRQDWLESFERTAGPDDRDTPYRRYFDEIRQGVATGWFDILSHFDMIKKFDDRPGHELAERFRPDIEAVLDAMAATKHMALELNTSGYDLFCREQFPSEPILRWAIDRGIPLTIGSDSHTITHVARHFDKARDLLDRLGVQELAIFRNHQRLLMPIDQLWPQAA